MRPDLPRLVLGPLGLFLGFVLYSQAGRLPEPWQTAIIGLAFLGLGGLAWVYAQGERWIQGLGLALMLYGLGRVLFALL